MADEKTFKKLKSAFELLSEIIKPKGAEENTDNTQNDGNRKIKPDLSKIEEIINTKIPDTLERRAPEDFYMLYTAFKAEYDKFRDFILYDRLIGKNIIALGGGFSCGKSTFLNALMGKQVLPEDIDPSTSVPTYIVKGDEHEVMGINVFDNDVKMEARDIKKIAHGFGEVEDEDGNRLTTPVTLGHVLETIFFSTPMNIYDHVAFLDTPGYSKPDSEKYSSKTDEEIARGQLNSSNYILWFVQADAGTITEEDIKFIKTLRQDIPILIVVSKADKKNIKDLKEIISKIRTTLDLKGVRYTDVLPFSGKPEQAEGSKELTDYIYEGAQGIRRQIEEWNCGVYVSSFAMNFKKLFVRCQDFYENEINEESRNLTRLNTSITKLDAEDIPHDILEPLQKMVDEAKKNVNELKNIKSSLKDLQNEFFTEIKYIADIVGIQMPEPSEIDFLSDHKLNPLEIIREYNTQNGIQQDPEYAELFKKTLKGIEPTINKQRGGSEYRAELAQIIKESCKLDINKIHINDTLKASKEFQAMINGISENETTMTEDI